MLSFLFALPCCHPFSARRALLTFPTVKVDNITSTGNQHWPNNDGIDIDNCANVVVRNSNFSVGIYWCFDTMLFFERKKKALNTFFVCTLLRPSSHTHKFSPGFPPLILNFYLSLFFPPHSLYLYF